MKPILSAAVCGVLKPGLGNDVNALLTSPRTKGIGVLESTSSADLTFANLMSMRLKVGGEEHSVSGTSSGATTTASQVDEVEVAHDPRRNILLVRNDDTPGTVLGARSINIARAWDGKPAAAAR